LDIKYMIEVVVPLLPTLRKSVIQGDLNDANVLVDAAGADITGVLDFGDSLYGCTAFDLGMGFCLATSPFPGTLLFWNFRSPAQFVFLPSHMHGVHDAEAGPRLHGSSDCRNRAARLLGSSLFA
jgi:aminoglycoside phosphotransferase (APT) family kinase protein